MAKSIAEKLLIKPGTTVFVWPSARSGLIGALPDGVRVVDGMEAATAAVLFVDDAATARAAFEAHREHLSQPALPVDLLPEGRPSRHQPRLAVADAHAVRPAADHPDRHR